MTLREALKQGLAACADIEVPFGKVELEVQKLGDDGYNVVSWHHDRTTPAHASPVSTQRDALELIDSWYPQLPAAESFDWYV